MEGNITHNVMKNKANPDKGKKKKNEIMTGDVMTQKGFFKNG